MSNMEYEEFDENDNESAEIQESIENTESVYSDVIEDIEEMPPESSEEISAEERYASELEEMLKEDETGESEEDTGYQKVKRWGEGGDWE